METVTPMEQARPQASLLFEQLEEPNWAPWLRFGADQLAAQAEVFPEGQIVLPTDAEVPAVMLSANRVSWSGAADTLPTWDDIAGPSQTFAETYRSDGNTFALMSMSVNPDNKGQGVTGQVFDKIREYAQGEGIDHIIGDFRPSGFGAYKTITGDTNFVEYCEQRRPDGMPQDPWLRAVTRQGAEFMTPDRRAMVVEATVDQVREWTTTYNPEKWWEVIDLEQIGELVAWHEPLQDLEQVDQVLECGETGTWYLDSANNKAVYIESNLWGEVPVVVKSEQETSVPVAEAKYVYDMPEEEFKRLESELVASIKDQHPEPDVYAAWISPEHPYANILRTAEIEYFPEIPELVTDEVEQQSLFYALIDTRNGEDRIVHGARLSGLSLEESNPGAHINGEVPGFIVIDELISDGKLSPEEFKAYCVNHGIDTKKSFSVETNFRVGDRVPSRNGVRLTDIAYMTFNDILGDSGSVDEGAVFASINKASLISFGRAGIGFAPVPYTPDPSSKEEKYKPVSLPYSEAMRVLATTLGDLAIVQQTNFK